MRKNGDGLTCHSNWAKKFKSLKIMENLNMFQSYMCAQFGNYITLNFKWIIATNTKDHRNEPKLNIIKHNTGNFQACAQVKHWRIRLSEKHKMKVMPIPLMIWTTANKQDDITYITGVQCRARKVNSMDKCNKQTTFVLTFTTSCSMRAAIS